MNGITEDLVTISQSFNQGGANVVPLKGKTKQPLAGWKKWQSQRQNEDHLASMPWDRASGVAVINGPGGWHSIDIDGCDDEQLILELLNHMDLPADYEWVVQSGNGFHIWFRSDEQSDRTCEEFECAGPRCKQIELRWSGCYTAVPPSIHPSGAKYGFKNGRPTSGPQPLSSTQVLEAIRSATKLSFSPSEDFSVEPSTVHGYPWGDDPDIVEDALKCLTDSLTGAPCYKRWLKISSAVVDGVGESQGEALLKKYLPPVDADGNDYKKKRGRWLDEVTVGTLFHQAKKAGWTPPKEDSCEEELDKDNSENGDSDDLPPPTCASDVEQRKIEWIWDGFIAEGMVHILDGDPGRGKSALLLGLAASFSQGKTPSGLTIPKLNSLYVSGEDPADTVLVPRYEAAGGDLDRLHIYDTSTAGRITIPDALEMIAEQIRCRNIKFCVIDPFFSLLSQEYSKNVEQEVRAVLSAVTSVAEETKCTFFLVRHFNKKEDTSALYRGGGSIGITAQARLAYALLPHPDNEDERILAWEKNNISKRGRSDSLVFQMQGRSTDGTGEQPVMKFARKESYTAEELLNGSSRGRPPTKRKRAKSILKTKLADGERPARELRKEVEDEDFSTSTFNRAARELDVKKEKRKGTTYWELPEEVGGYSISASD